MLGGGWLLFGRGGDESGSSKSTTAREKPANDWNTEPTKAREAKLPPSRCAADSSNCVVASGRVIYVEKVDPDGDGDAHFVAASEQGVTLPGITIFDVRADLRPNPLPGVGDLVGGAGPVYPGHAGQKQIQVEEFHVAK
ncbi:MAG: hypothetical protein J0H66_03220 [Solirubrobacterales bacterium]|nr:hypothetical protein [Solirubrobacterales bacterium]OJU96113.1 MAG: hypothetical protein BGO23_00885 [Solirubrobacterales bacterium 67-14]